MKTKKTGAAARALVLLALSAVPAWAVDVHLPRVVSQPVVVQPVAAAVAANLRAAPVVLPQVQALPVAVSIQPVLLPQVVSVARIQAAQVAVEQAPAAVRIAAVFEAVAVAQNAAPADQAREYSKLFENSGGNGSGAVDLRQAPERVDSGLVQERRLFRKELKRASQGEPLTQAQADALAKKAMELGIPMRIHPSDLAPVNNHWKRGPHIHIGDAHVPVEPGYVPTLVEGYIHLN